jgi:uncharacterized protein YegP (UPF0339 family)
MKKIHLSIPKPCHEDWGAMTPSDKGRFCGSCQKTVIDFTIMSDRQLAEFFKKPPSSVCGRVYDDQLNRDIIIPKKRIPWVKYFFQFSLPAFLVSMKANSQKPKTLIGDTTYCTSIMDKVEAPKAHSEDKIIKGQILDDRGNKISFATISIKNTKMGVQADAEGIFKINVPLNSTLIFSAVGYNSKEIALDGKTVNLIVVFETKDIALAGEVVMVGYITPKRPKATPLIKNLVDTAFKRFLIYPSPIQRSSSFKIKPNKIDAGEYVVSIMSLNGEVVQAKELTVESKKKILDFQLKDFASGTYIVRFSNKRTGATYSEKIIVQ